MIAGTTALILAGHGSHISPETAGVVWQHVDRLRAMGVADEITAAFWKEMPSFHRVLHTLMASDVTVVPLFTAQGYFTRTVIPTEMGLNGALTERDRRILRYARTLSEHSYLGQVVDRRVQDALRQFGLAPEQTAVAVIGHSTKRMPESREATESQAKRVRAAGMVAEVLAVYLDDDPRIADVYDLTSAPNLIAIPYFLALGSHTTQDVPSRLGLQPGQTVAQIKGRTVIYTLPVGIEQDLTEVILHLAEEAGTPLRSVQAHGTAWDAFPSAGRDDLLAEVQRAGALTFGQLLLTEQVVQPLMASGDARNVDRLDSPAALRDRVRGRPFRPLATSTDLPKGWRVEITRPEMLHAVVETVYPGAVADWSAWRRAELARESFESTIARQTGMYRPLAALGASGRAETVSRVCGKCVCSPLWIEEYLGLGKLPCAEVCNVWLTAALGAED